MSRREQEERPLPAHPYRDSAIVYGVMACILVVVAGVTGGSLVRALGAGTLFWLVAIAWSWWKFRGRIRERDAAEAAAAQRPVSSLDPEASGADPAAGQARVPTNGTVNGALGVNGNGRGSAGGGGSAES